MSALFGFTGFVGGWLLKEQKYKKLYNSKNFQSAKNKNFDYVYFSGLPATKWKINQNGEEDNDNIQQIKNVLDTVSVSQLFVLISTIDIYDVNTDKNLNEDCCEYSNHAYGSHRREFEEYVKQKWPENHLIIRLPALFGQGLKKNIVYDLLHNHRLEYINRNTAFQWYDMKWLWSDIQWCIQKREENNENVFNLFTEPVETSFLVKIANNGEVGFFGDRFMYNIKTKHSESGYIRSKTDVQNALRTYFQEQTSENGNDIDRLCISTITIAKMVYENTDAKTLFLQFCTLLKNYGIKWFELTPSLFMNWDSFGYENLRELFQYSERIVGDNCPKIYSMQSLTFGINPPPNLFDSQGGKELLSHLEKVSRVASMFGVKVLVFGCPKNRRIGENIEKDTNIAIDFFRKLGDRIETTVCIENNSSKYNCNFLTTSQSVNSFVSQVNHPNIKAMNDIGNCKMESESVEEFCKLAVCHIHISEPFMKPLTSSDLAEIISEIKKNGYDKKFTLEALTDSIKDLDQSIKILKELFKLSW